MTFPKWFNPDVCGAQLGAAAHAIVGFSWGGWVTRGAVQDTAEDLPHETLTTAMVPVCLETARSDPQRLAKLEPISTASRHQQRGGLMEAGWATLRSDTACIAIVLPENAHLDRSGNRWRCDKGFTSKNGGCALER